MSNAELLLELERLRKRNERERRARQEAEALAEQGTRLLYERSRQIQLLYVIADAASAAPSKDAAIMIALDELCAYTSWPVGHAYLVTEDSLYPLAPTKLWHLDHADQYAAFREASEKLHFRRGEGLPGRVFDTGRPLWVRDVTEDENFPRREEAKKIGVRGAFAIPVIAADAVVAVLEFFSREEAEPEESWVEITSQVGVQVGRTFEREARDVADRANRAKSEFLSRMSHELRTPLNAILGFGQLLEIDKNITEKQSRSVQHILKGGRHLLGLINEVLDVSRIEAGHMEVSLAPIHVSDILAETLDLLRPLAAQRNIPITGEAANTIDRYVLADRQRLRQILLNLLSNAIKYNRAGGSVSVECTEIGSRVRFSISDTGVGISADKLPKLFTPFERLGAENSGIEGTGLGLALSRRLAELMGGSLGVESVVGKGSTFWVEVPCTTSPFQVVPSGLHDAAPSKPTASPTNTVLYIEDNLSNLQLVEGILADRRDIKLLVAMRAELGLELALQHLPDLILLDLNLPDMSGHEVLKRLRSNPRASAIPVVMISADAMSEQVDRLVAAGATAYLTKPLEIPLFFETIDRVLTTSRLRTTPAISTK